MAQYQYNLYRHSSGSRSIELGHERELSPSGLIIPRALARITFRKLARNNSPSATGIIISLSDRNGIVRQARLS